MKTLKERYEAYVTKENKKHQDKYKCFRFAYNRSERLLMEQIDLYQDLNHKKEISAFISKKKFEENEYELIGNIYVRTYEEYADLRTWKMCEIVMK